MEQSDQKLCKTFQGCKVLQDVAKASNFSVCKTLQKFCKTLQNFARLCKSFKVLQHLQTIAKLCKELQSFAKSLQQLAKVCKFLQQFAQICTSLQQFAQVCNTLHKSCKTTANLLQKDNNKTFYKINRSHIFTFFIETSSFLQDFQCIF